MGKVILVGVDGSEGSRRALHWALGEARLRGTNVHVITTWPAREPAGSPPVEPEEARRRADDMQRHLVDTVLRQFTDPPRVSYELVQGDPVEVLLQASGDADLLVIGSHSTASMRHAMLGSVSEACARLAGCPVVVLPVPDPTPEPDRLPAAAQRPTDH